ncbi:MAG: TonB-dependent receptor [Flavobacteriaceae bacterium]|nr:TonB-dependent receptor [Flavobacteriaceae bacterium]
MRGFDIDHGTDVAISVDGLPVNMVSHAHGQGYADLHFVIPETIEDINFGKGPYYPDHGNFTTAGFVDLHLKKRVNQNILSLEAGQFNTLRLMGMFSLLDSENSNSYLATEIYLTDGPFDSPQNFNRINLMGQYNYSLPGNQELSLRASYFQSKWDASGQIPQRAVDDGSISRFGAIDDTEGGQTGRGNFLINYIKNLDANKTFLSNAYLSMYDFELYSNFTFYLEDPVNGDQIRQKERRIITGAEGIFENKNRVLGNEVQFSYRAGGGFRYDKIDDLELSHTVNRQTLLERMAYGDVDEANLYGFLNTEFKKGKWLLNPALRLDYFNFAYYDRLSETYDHLGVDKATFSPKLNTIFTANEAWQLFLKTGIGFHSNDSRVVVAQNGEDILPPAYGADLGTIWRPFGGLVFNAAAWYLYMEQEFVYVGDAGIVEPAGRSRRLGLDFGVRYQLLDWLYLYGDVNYAYARSMDEPSGSDYIPLAPDLTSTGGIVMEDLKRFSGALNYRYMDDRPANEDNSMVAEGYFVLDFNLNYSLRHWSFGLIIENLLDTELE